MNPILGMAFGWFRKRFLSLFIYSVGVIILVPIVVSFICFSWVFIYTHVWHIGLGEKELERFLEFRVPELTEVFDINGTRIVQFGGVYWNDPENKRTSYYSRWIEPEKMPPLIWHVALSAEDKKFFDHNGVNYFATGKAFLFSFVRSFVASIKNRKLSLAFSDAGGSTITQQAVRMAFLGDDLARERSEGSSKWDKLNRKIEEIRLTIWIERRLKSHFANELGIRLIPGETSSEWLVRIRDKKIRERAARMSKKYIFALWANTSYCGRGRYGLSAAADLMFGKPLDIISPSEAAIVVNTIRNPRIYDPWNEHKRVVAARNRTLSIMAKRGYPPEPLLPEYHEEELNVSPLPEKTHIRAPSAVNYLVNSLWSSGDKGLIWANGIRVASTIDLRLQEFAENSLRNGLDEYISRYPDHIEDLQGAIVVLANNGEIRAMVGGRDPRYTDFNRATEAYRQPGSTFKALLYISAFDNGWRIDCDESGQGSCTVLDGPISVNMGGGRKHYIDNYGGRYFGNMPMWRAFARSQNTPAIRLMNNVGPDKVVSLTLRMGLGRELRKYPTTALGAEELTPLELTSLYMVIANHGNYFPTRIVREIVSDRESKRFGLESSGVPVIAPRVAWQALKALRHTVLWREGTARKLKELPFQVGGKTGTSNDFKDAWFCGFTYGVEGMTACVWVGRDKGESLGNPDRCAPLVYDSSQYNNKDFCEPGSKVAMPIFKEFMEKAYDGLEYVAPAFPKGIDNEVLLAHSRLK